MDTQKWYCDPEWITIIIAFFSTLFLGFIAIFQNWIRSWFRKPKLKISIKKEPPDCHKAVFRNQKTGEYICDSYYFRFKVENVGNYQMENVEAMAIEIEQKNSSGQYEKKKDFLPMNLVWSYYRSIPMSVIQPKLFKHCDLGHILKSEYADLERFGKTRSSNVVFLLDVAKETFIGAHILEPGDYKIKIKVASNNLKPKTKVYNLVLKDEWLDDEITMFARNIVIREIS